MILAGSTAPTLVSFKNASVIIQAQLELMFLQIMMESSLPATATWTSLTSAAHL